MAKLRIERDSLGTIEVPTERLWGAQTQRALRYFEISTERMPADLIRALAHIKRAAADVNSQLGLIDPAKAGAIIQAADEIIAGGFDHEFPLAVWQTGSGTQTNMNINEVLANRASELLGGERGQRRLVHPNDDVNKCQSTNDVFPTAMHVAAAQALLNRVLPSLERLRAAFYAKQQAFQHIVKIGRTHLQDATPLTVGQEFSGYVAQLDHGLGHIKGALPHIFEIGIGGTAVGTGLNAHPEFAGRMSAQLARLTQLPFVSAANKFEAMACHDALVHAHGALKTVAASLMKIANDIRWLASGPRAGLGELRLPENEPGSSIMPGKINPTQCEALTMACCQVFGNDVAINIGGALGNFELNAYKPMIIYNFLQSTRLIADSSLSFSEYCVKGIEVNEVRMTRLVGDSLMLVTALSPHIGYDSAVKIAKHAHERNISLREAAIGTGLVTGERFDLWVRPETMVSPTILPD
jgi:fumarate hydratase, class II